MRANLLYLFQTEVHQQCRHALLAWRDLQAALGPGGCDHDRAWYSIQNFLVAAALVSRILWPGRPGPCRPGAPRKERSRQFAAQARKSLGVRDDSPLKSRTARDHLEHFDSRLETWARNSKHRNFVDSNIGPPGKIRLNVPAEDRMRHFDPKTNTLTFQGKSYPLATLAAAIETLAGQAGVATDRTFRSVDTARGTIFPRR